MTSRKKYRPSYSFQSEMAHPSKVYPGARANSTTYPPAKPERILYVPGTNR
jgi:hypothetical protein